VNQSPQLERAVEAGARRVDRAPERSRERAPATRVGDDDRLAGDLLMRALAQQLIVVEDWCGCHSEYFLG
jgi:hypothetical protein